MPSDSSTPLPCLPRPGPPVPRCPITLPNSLHLVMHVIHSHPDPAKPHCFSRFLACDVSMKTSPFWVPLVSSWLACVPPPTPIPPSKTEATPTSHPHFSTHITLSLAAWSRAARRRPAESSWLPVVAALLPGRVAPRNCPEIARKLRLITAASTRHLVTGSGGDGGGEGRRCGAWAGEWWWWWWWWWLGRGGGGTI